MTKPKPPSRKAGQPKPPTRNARKSVKNSRTSPERIKRVERQREALDYRKQGYSYPQIADHMKVSVATAYELVTEALKAIIQEPAEQVLALELDRVDMLLTGFTESAVSGDNFKLQGVLSLLSRRDKLLGIALPDKFGSQAQKVELTGANGGPIVTAEVTDETRAKALAAFVAKYTARKQGEKDG